DRPPRCRRAIARRARPAGRCSAGPAAGKTSSPNGAPRRKTAAPGHRAPCARPARSSPASSASPPRPPRSTASSPTALPTTPLRALAGALGEDGETLAGVLEREVALLEQPAGSRELVRLGELYERSGRDADAAATFRRARELGIGPHADWALASLAATGGDTG